VALKDRRQGRVDAHRRGAGFATIFVYYPKRDFAVALLMNASSWSMLEPTVAAIAKLYLPRAERAPQSSSRLTIWNRSRFAKVCRVSEGLIRQLRLLGSPDRPGIARSRVGGMIIIFQKWQIDYF
jgi:hypothetical protein